MTQTTIQAAADIFYALLQLADVFLFVPPLLTAVALALGEVPFLLPLLPAAAVFVVAVAVAEV